MVRLFIALPVEQDLKKNLSRIDEFISGHGRSLKIVGPENYHITVKFLGECTNDIAAKIENSFLKIDFPRNEIPFTAAGLGVFPNMKMPSVIWAGLRTHDSKIQELYREVESSAAALGFEKEKRGFSPHLTIARVRKGKVIDDTLKNYIAENKETVFGESSFKKLVLYSSSLTPAGPVYTEVKTLSFNS